MATILIADDRPLDREYLKTVLGLAGHEVLEAGDGAEGLELARERAPDLVVSGIVMPGMDGFEFVHKLRQQTETRAIPVIFVTATYLEKEAGELARICGVQHVLIMPCEPEKLLNMVRLALKGEG